MRFTALDIAVLKDAHAASHSLAWSKSDVEKAEQAALDAAVVVEALIGMEAGLMALHTMQVNTNRPAGVLPDLLALIQQAKGQP